MAQFKELGSSPKKNAHSRLILNTSVFKLMTLPWMLMENKDNKKQTEVIFNHSLCWKEPMNFKEGWTSSCLISINTSFFSTGLPLARTR